MRGQMHKVGRVGLLGRRMVMLMIVERDADDMPGLVDMGQSVVPGRQNKHADHREYRDQRRKAPGRSDPGGSSRQG